MSIQRLAYAGTIFGIFLTLNNIKKNYDFNKVFSYEDPIQPPYTVSVIAPAWHEPDDLLRISLSSLKHQTVVQHYPKLFEFIFVGCEGVNLNIPAELGYRILCAPRGKLNARHVGIMNANGDIIVSVDCDSYYPPNWLNLVLQPFHDDDVVGVTTTTWQGELENFVSILKLITYANRMSGRGSAFLKRAYIEIGGFDLDIDQLNLTALVNEEEFFFRQRLERVGKVVLVDAPVIHLGGKTVGRGLRTYPRGKHSYVL
jgi:cellulose synthase/poly-beta-1,6-N-acetylglucosamine synthase-like glycosyltransferase